MPRSIGWDIAGWSGNKSRVATAEYDAHSIRINLIKRSTPITASRNLSSNAALALADEVNFIRKITDNGRIPIAIDIPIDLQHLPSVLSGEINEAASLKDLMSRKIDVHYGAWPPLCDKFGVSVFRIRSLLGLLDEPSWLGISIFETYPTACLRESLGLDPRTKVPSYKGQVATFTNQKWRPLDADKSGLADLLNMFSWTATDGFHIDDDSFDAAICCFAAMELQSPAVDNLPAAYVICSNLLSDTRPVQLEAF